MRSIILWMIVGFATGFVLAMLLNPIFWGGEDYADAVVWGIVGAITGFLWTWWDARHDARS